MKTIQFFETLATLNVEGKWQLTIKAAGNRMLVSVLYTNDNVGDKAKNLIPPLILKGTAEELDNGFMDAIETPVKKTASLLVNMEEYLKAQETARLQSKMEQDKKQQAGKAVDKKYEAQMKKVEELEQAGKYREAYAQLPKASDFPDREEDIQERKEELAEKFDQTGLFANNG